MVLLCCKYVNVKLFMLEECGAVELQPYSLFTSALDGVVSQMGPMSPYRDVFSGFRCEVYGMQPMWSNSVA